MRVWLADPCYLSTPHLLGAHNELHALIRVVGGESEGWARHPEALRFSEVDGGLGWLLLMHELTRVAMDLRWPGRHGCGVHLSPVVGLGCHVSELVFFEGVCSGGDVFPSVAVGGEQRRGSFRSWLLGRGFPLTRLEHDTPWERDAVPFSWYRDHERDWSHALVDAYHGGPPVGGRRYHGSRLVELV